MDIITLLKANIRYKKGSFLCVLLLTFIISLCLNAIISINFNVNKRVEDSFQQNKVSDLTAIIWDVSCPDSMLKQVENSEDIDHIRVVKTIAWTFEINNLKQNNTTFFADYSTDMQSYQIYNEDGLSFNKSPEKLQPGEIYVPISFKQLYDCKTGDKVYPTSGNETQYYIIKGFFEEPFLGNEMIGIKLALMNTEDFKALYNWRIQSEEGKDIADGIRCFYFVNIYQEKNSSKTISDLKRTVNDSSGIVNYSVVTISKEQSKSITLMLTQIISGIMMIFLLLLFVVVLIVMGHSISTGIEMEYTNLGVLKAIGFPKSKLRIVFVLEYILAELIGAVVGIIGSIPSVYYLNAMFVRMTGLLSDVKPAFGICLSILAVILLISVLFIFVKTRAIIKVSPVCAISGGRNSIYFHSRLEIPVEGNGLFTRMAVRQLTSNKKQYRSSIIIVAILTFFLVMITVLNTGLDEQTIENSFGVTYSDIGIAYNPDKKQSREELTELQKQVELDMSKVSPIDKAFRIDNDYFMVNGDEYHGSIYEDTELIKSILKGRVPHYDNEIAITEIVAKELGVKIGNKVTVGNADMEDEYIITGYFQSTYDLGRTIAMSQEGAKRILPDYHMDYVDYVIADSSKSAEIVKILEKEYGEQIEAKDEHTQDDVGDTIMNSMSILNNVIYTISILFAFVVIIIVCGKIFLKERTDYGIYKALGFTSSALRLQFAMRFAFVALLGSVLGIILNICLNSTIMNVLLTSVGITSFPAGYTTVSLLMPVIVLTVCFFVFAFFVSAKIKRVDTKTLISNS